jgi:O-antigen/teichoic acid export membrane protein
VIAIVLMLVLYPLMGTRGLALAVVISTFCQALYYLFHSAKVLNISMLQILPLQKLVIRLVIFFALYFFLFFLLSGVDFKIKLLIGAVVTTIIVVAGMMKYFKTFFTKQHVQNS